MTTRINISSLVKNASAYAADRAAKADKNGDGVLSASETRHLPNDLRDNLARMRAAHPKTAITVDAFASSFRGYVAAAAKRADKNKNGFLTPGEVKTLPENLRDNVEKLWGTPATPKPPSNGGGTPDTLGGISVTKATQTKDVAALNTSLSLAPDWHFFGETYHVDPAKLQAALADPEKNKAFFNDLLFHASGSTYQKNYPDYYGPSGLTVTSRPVSSGAGDLDKTFADMGAFTDLGKDQTKVDADLAKVQQHLAAGGATKAVNLLWSNHDDASFYGFATFNEKTGEVRVAGWYPEV